MGQAIEVVEARITLQAGVHGVTGVSFIRSNREFRYEMLVRVFKLCVI